MVKSNPFPTEAEVRLAVQRHVVQHCHREWPKNAWFRLSEEWAINVYIYADPDNVGECRASVNPVIDGTTLIDLGIDFDFTQYCRRIDTE